MKEFILLINTSDEIGLVYNVSKILYANNLNIIQNSEYVDQNTNKFFMRTIVKNMISRSSIINTMKTIQNIYQLSFRSSGRVQICNRENSMIFGYIFKS